MLALIIWMATAGAADHELSLEVGSIGATDPAYSLVSDTQSLSTLGLRAGYAVHDRVAIIGSWHHGQSGATVNNVMDMAFFADTFTLGAKVDYTLWDLLQPYASLQGVFLRSHFRIDDDPNHTDTGNKLSVAGLTGGGVGALGLEVRVPMQDRPLTAGVYGEVGYALLAEATYGDLGGMQLGGLYARAGVGVRF